jgi:hypothetical protein
MQDRPMLGGNASSEMRMWVLGAHGKNNQETGIIEELFLNNYYRNPYKNFSIWDSIMWEIVKQEKNITLILNCSCLDAEMKGSSIVSVTGWQTTTQMYHKVQARHFADCSGDSVLAPLSGAEYRVGHEARAEFNEDIAPVYADRKTMGMSILIQAREKTFHFKNPFTFEDVVSSSVRLGAAFSSCGPDGAHILLDSAGSFFDKPFFHFFALGHEFEHELDGSRRKMALLYHPAGTFNANAVVAQRLLGLFADQYRPVAGFMG